MTAGALLAIGLSILPLPARERPRQHREIRMEATAYAQHGTTLNGTKARRGVIAADPRILPMGTKVRVTGAGEYSGHYVVEDTGRGIKGREIDLFIPSHREAKRFGRKDVKVKVVKPAPGK